MEQQQALDGSTWLQLDAPSTEELTDVWERFGLPALALEAIRHRQPRPRVDHIGEYLLVVLKPATYVDPDEVVRIGQVTVLSGPGLLLTIGDAAQHLPSGRSGRDPSGPKRPASTPDAILHAIVDEVVEGYATVLAGLENDVDQIETQVFGDPRGSHAERIYRLKSEVQDLRRAVAPLPDELDDLTGLALLEGRGLPGSHQTGSTDLDGLADLFRDVRGKAVRTAEHVAHLEELLQSALSAHLAQITIQQNNDMRRISAWVAIVAAPTAIGSIYGMNFEFMPELEWRYSYFVVLGAMAAACIVLYRLFKRSGWL